MADQTLIQPPVMTIETPRLRLRTLTPSKEDLDALTPVVTNPKTMLMTHGVMPNDREKIEQWVRARSLGKDVFMFLILLKSGEAGRAGEVPIGLVGSRKMPNVGYIVHADHAGKGYATEAVRAWIPAFFARFPIESGVDFVEARVDDANGGSLRVLEKCGFQEVGILKGGFENAKLGVRDVVVLRRAREGKSLEEIGAERLSGEEVGEGRGEDWEEKS